MAKYSKERNYDNQIALNATRKDYNCPCCGKSFLILDAKLERFELDREIVYRPKLGYKVRYGAYRVCSRCDKKKKLLNFISDNLYKDIYNHSNYHEYNSLLYQL